MIHPLIIC